MALLINDNCTACDACKPVCPNEAISVGDIVYLIDPFKCTECVGAHDNPKCVEVCPIEGCITVNAAYGESRVTHKLQLGVEGMFTKSTDDQNARGGVTAKFLFPEMKSLFALPIFMQHMNVWLAASTPSACP